MTDELCRSAGTDEPATIALVDDDRNILASVSMALEAEGFEVDTYTDGDRALRGLGSDTSGDLAILDIKMPRMDGMELLSRNPPPAENAGHLPRRQRTTRWTSFRASGWVPTTTSKSRSRSAC